MVNGTILIPVLLIYAIVSYKVYKNGSISYPQYIVYLIFAVYFLVLIAATMFPIPTDKRLIQEIIASGYYDKAFNLIPFKTIIEMMDNSTLRITALRNIGGNLLLLMPLGFFVPLFWDKYDNLKILFVIGLFSTVMIEFLQLLISFIIGYRYKSFDVDDIILNVIGFCIGSIIYKLLCMLLSKIEEMQSDDNS
jgi:glycopeptide antibiotics resistance protein